MKIINLDQFLKLPNGTLYVKYRPHIFEEICIKGDTISEDDWFYADLLEVDSLSSLEAVDLAFKSIDEGTSFDLDIFIESRDGCYEKDQLFAVYERKDVVQLIDRLNDVLNKAY